MLLFTIPDVDEMFNKYGIYSEFDWKNYNDNCLVNVLKHNNIEESIINSVKSMTKGWLYIP